MPLMASWSCLASSGTAPLISHRQTQHLQKPVSFSWMLLKTTCSVFVFFHLFTVSFSGTNNSESKRPKKKKKPSTLTLTTTGGGGERDKGQERERGDRERVVVGGGSGSSSSQNALGLSSRKKRPKLPVPPAPSIYDDLNWGTCSTITHRVCVHDWLDESLMRSLVSTISRFMNEMRQTLLNVCKRENIWGTREYICYGSVAQWKVSVFVIKCGFCMWMWAGASICFYFTMQVIVLLHTLVCVDMRFGFTVTWKCDMVCMGWLYECEWDVANILFPGGSCYTVG